MKGGVGALSKIARYRDDKGFLGFNSTEYVGECLKSSPYKGLNDGCLGSCPVLFTVLS